MLVLTRRNLQYEWHHYRGQVTVAVIAITAAAAKSFFAFICFSLFPGVMFAANSILRAEGILAAPGANSTT